MIHDCAGNCGRHIEAPLLACLPCYRRLPDELRKQHRFWLPHRFEFANPRGARAFQRVQAACVAWWREHPGEGQA